MHLALIQDGRVHAETDVATAALTLPSGKRAFDVRDVSGVPGIAPGWLAKDDGTYSPPVTKPEVEGGAAQEIDESYLDLELE